MITSQKSKICLCQILNWVLILLGFLKMKATNKMTKHVLISHKCTKDVEQMEEMLGHVQVCTLKTSAQAHTEKGKRNTETHKP